PGHRQSLPSIDPGIYEHDFAGAALPHLFGEKAARADENSIAGVDEARVPFGHLKPQDVAPVAIDAIEHHVPRLDSRDLGRRGQIEAASTTACALDIASTATASAMPLCGRRWIASVNSLFCMTIPGQAGI